MEIEKEKDQKASDCFAEIKRKTGKDTTKKQSNDSGDFLDHGTHHQRKRRCGKLVEDERKRRCGKHVEDEDDSDDDASKELVPKVRKRSGSMSCYRKISANSSSTIYATAKECADMVEKALQPVSSAALTVTAQFDGFPIASTSSHPPVIYEDSEPSDKESSSGRDSPENQRMKDSRIDYADSRKSGQSHQK
uniref:Uncharacterized protein n=1 Tax=Panagrolaimus sp. JU765 TaxID=591449 RepID=A0AC34Q126_9BILA